jgi:hypothetical protein
MILTTSVEWSDRPSSNYHLGHSIKKRDPGPPGRRRGGKGSAVLGPAF